MDLSKMLAVCKVKSSPSVAIFEILIEPVPAEFKLWLQPVYILGETELTTKKLFVLRGPDSTKIKKTNLARLLDGKLFLLLNPI